jgi:hypothetical protein
MFALELFDQLEVQLEQVAHEAQHELQILLPLGELAHRALDPVETPLDWRRRTS